MATVADLLRLIAKAQLEDYLKFALEILKDNKTQSIKTFVQQTGLAKIELALCEAYMEVMIKRREELQEEVRRHARRERPRKRV